MTVTVSIIIALSWKCSFLPEEMTWFPILLYIDLLFLPKSSVFLDFSYSPYFINMSPRKVIPIPNFLSDTPPFMPFLSRCWGKALWVMSECCRFFGFFGISGMAHTLTLWVLGFPESGLHPEWSVHGSYHSMLVLGLCWACSSWNAWGDHIPVALLLLIGMRRTSVFLSWSLLTKPLKPWLILQES